MTTEIVALTTPEASPEPPPPPSPTTAVTLHEGVADRLKEMLAHVQQQAKGLDSAVDYQDLAHRQREFIDLQHSLLRSLITRFAGSRHDGDLDVFLDAELSLFWRHPKSVYHGGINFHGNRWSVNT